jgi:hypothetical protein
MAFDKQRFSKLLEQFKYLNPDLIDGVTRELESFIGKHNKECYELIEAAAADIVDQYLSSPVKRAEKNELEQYFRIISRSADKLIKAGTMDEAQPADATVGLVPKHYYSNQQWMLLNSQGRLPESIATAVDACRKRHELVKSVLEPLFVLMLRFDPEQAVQYHLKLIQKHNESIDPDLARDLLRSWAQTGTSHPDITRTVISWAGDNQANRHWPTVTREADAFLRKRYLTHWFQSPASREPWAAQLRMCHPFQKEQRLLRWFKERMSNIGEGVDFFCSQAEKRTDEDWRSAAMLQEIRTITSLFHPILILSDLLLSRPDGTLSFCMALFGFTTDYRNKWRAALIEQSRKAIRKCFIQDLRAKRKPLDTIHRLSFGDRLFEESVHSELDILTDNFGSISQREVVVERLAEMYAGYREDKLLPQAISYRYRRTMRVLHEDNLKRIFSSKELQEIENRTETIQDLTTTFGACRKYLTTRRALIKSTDEIIAADQDLKNILRTMRTKCIRSNLTS